MSKPAFFDYVIVGGGIFGSYAATYLGKAGKKVALIEKENTLFSGASVINQARLHEGYHYPRSIKTALQANDYKERFLKEHIAFVNRQFDHYYAIAKHASFTNKRHFENFCSFTELSLERADHRFSCSEFEAVYRTQEYSFDPILLKHFYTEKLRQDPNIHCYLGHHITWAEESDGLWELTVSDGHQETLWKSPAVINATYSQINTINRLFGQKELEIFHELAEMCLVQSQEFENSALTVMDGKFFSVMPYGLTGLTSLTSVQYTPHEVSPKPNPTFSCQQLNLNCTPHNVQQCTYCPARPKTNFHKMRAQLRKYTGLGDNLTHFTSFWTVKTKLNSSFVDDARPTELSLLSRSPFFLCLFSGKINSIYEIEKILSYE